MKNPAIELLLVARQIANFAESEGVLISDKPLRVTCNHLGAVLADSVLQSGLNYSTVVRPRVLSILNNYPELNAISPLMVIVEENRVGEILNWRHYEKIERFKSLVLFLDAWGVINTEDLRYKLLVDDFMKGIKDIRGIGPKTVDYMACLVGIDSIAIDRHVRSFAKAANVVVNDYESLKASFCYAADLLSLSRREFDAWLWHRATMKKFSQLSLSM